MAEGFEKTTDFDSIPLNLDEPMKTESTVKLAVEVTAVSSDTKGSVDILTKDKDERKKTHSLKRFFSLRKASEELNAISTEDEPVLDNENKRGSLARRLRLKSRHSDKKDSKKDIAIDDDKNNDQPKLPKNNSLHSTISVYWDNIFRSKNKENPSAVTNIEAQTQTESKE